MTNHPNKRRPAAAAFRAAREKAAARMRRLRARAHGVGVLPVETNIVDTGLTLIALGYLDPKIDPANDANRKMVADAHAKLIDDINSGRVKLSRDA